MIRWAFLVLLATPLWAQATPSIAPRMDERRDVVTLREYIDIRLQALQDVIEAQATAQQKAIDKAEESINKRLEGVPQTFIMKNEFNARVDAVDTRLNAIENRFSNLDGSLKALAFVLGLLQVIIGAFVAWLFQRSRNGRAKAP